MGASAALGDLRRGPGGYTVSVDLSRSVYGPGPVSIGPLHLWLIHIEETAVGRAQMAEAIDRVVAQLSELKLAQAARLGQVASGRRGP